MPSCVYSLFWWKMRVTPVPQREAWNLVMVIPMDLVELFGFLSLYAHRLPTPFHIHVPCRGLWKSMEQEATQVRGMGRHCGLMVLDLTGEFFPLKIEKHKLVGILGSLHKWKGCLSIRAFECIVVLDFHTFIYIFLYTIGMISNMYTHTYLYYLKQLNCQYILETVKELKCIKQSLKFVSWDG